MHVYKCIGIVLSRESSKGRESTELLWRAEVTRSGASAIISLEGRLVGFWHVLFAPGFLWSYV